MQKDKALHLRLIIYASVTVFLFVYLLPFIFIGYYGYDGEMKIAQKTVLEVQRGGEYPLLTNFAIWYAESKTLRLILATIFVGGMFLVEFFLPSDSWKFNIYYIIMWISLICFMISAMGLIALLV